MGGVVWIISGLLSKGAVHGFASFDSEVHQMSKYL